MQPLDIITRKRDGLSLQQEELDYLVSGYLSGSVPDYQMSAFLMSVFLQGFDRQEMADYTWSLVNSGQRLKWKDLPGPVVDKHSSGGVGDKTSLVVVPLLAAAGLYAPKMSGRGLGFTGGTIDKLESIPGLKTVLSTEQLHAQVSRTGGAIVSQSPELTPADGKIYELRDVTATVDSIPLIAASIMSKKIAGGANHIILDVKTGSGAFMKKKERAVKLAASMVGLGERLECQVKAVVTDMNQPLGHAIGNSLEIQEVLSALRGEGPADLRELALSLTAHLIKDAGKASNYEEAFNYTAKLLDEGWGYEKFREIVEAQNGDFNLLENSEIPAASMQEKIKSSQRGYIVSMDASKLGRASLYLGAGRLYKGDDIDPEVGIEAHRKVGDFVDRGDSLLTLYANDRHKLDAGLQEASQAFKVQEEKVSSLPLIYQVVDGESAANIYIEAEQK